MSDLFSPVSVLSKLSLQKAQRNLDDSKGFLYNDFRGIAKILSLYNPLEVMKMSLWEERRIYALDLKDEVKRRASVLLPIVLESIMESDIMDGTGSNGGKSGTGSGIWTVDDGKCYALFSFAILTELCEK